MISVLSSFAYRHEQNNIYWCKSVIPFKLYKDFTDK